jgi:hypothetical protein
MAALILGQIVVATGTFLYDGIVECDLRIVFSPIRYGSHDYEDEPEIADDIVTDTYYIEYGSTTQRGVFNAGGGGYPSLAEARAVAEKAPGFGPTVRWQTGGPV